MVLSKEEIKLKVDELFGKDSERGIARIPRKRMKELNVEDGDIIEIIGKKSTSAVVLPSYPSDVNNNNIIRIDGLVRKNCESSIDDIVTIKKIKTEEAKKIVLAFIPQENLEQENLNMLREMITPEKLKNKLFMRPLTKGDIIVPNRVFKRREDMHSDMFEGFSILGTMFNMSMNISEELLPNIKLVVAETNPAGIVHISEKTDIVIKFEIIEVEKGRIQTVSYEDIGGLGDAKQKIREMIELPLKHPELFERLGIEPPKGVMLFGPPGTGKTLLAKAVANEAGANFISLAGPEIMSKWYGQSEENLRRIFEDAQKNAPTIIFIDEIDAIAPKREEVTGEVEKRVVSQLLTLMDGLKSRGRIIIIAATNRPNSIDPALRRGGRFDREIEIPVPDSNGRKQILEIHTKNMPLIDVNLDKIAEITYGFVGADLAALAKEAAMGALRRVLPEVSSLKENEQIPKEVLEKLRVTKEDFEYGLRMVQPSAMREVMIEVPKVKWSDVGGMEEVKQSLKEAVEWPLSNQESFKRLGIRPARGILLYGPPGCGKTYIVKALANEAGVNFITVKGPEIMSKWVGESEENIRKIFRKAKQVSPAIIFFDEIDAIAPRRGQDAGTRVSEQIVSQILTEMSGIEELEGVVVIAATNRPDIIDPALLRPGRFDQMIYVPAPDRETRRNILEVHTRNVPVKGISIEKLSEKTEGYSGADIEAVVREAAMQALRESIKAKEVGARHFDEALKKVKPSITKDMFVQYQKAVEELKKTKLEEEEKARYIG